MKTLEELESEDDRINTVQIEHDNTIAELEKRVEQAHARISDLNSAFTALRERVDFMAETCETPRTQGEGR